MRVWKTHGRAIASALLVGLGVSATGRAATVLSGSYSDQSQAGYTTGAGTYTVFASAAFNANGSSGIVGASGTQNLTVLGGQFEHNHVDGIFSEAANLDVLNGTFDSDGQFGVVQLGGSASISAGQFENDYDGIDAGGNATVTISGGTFSGNSSVDVENDGATITITGGSFDPADVSLGVFDPNGEIDLLGTFPGLTPGQTKDLPEGLGSFTGTLLNDAAAQTLSYANQGTIILIDVAPVPEPAALALFAAAGLGWRRRRRVPLQPA